MLGDYKPSGNQLTFLGKAFDSWLHRVSFVCPGEGGREWFWDSVALKQLQCRAIVRPCVSSPGLFWGSVKGKFRAFGNEEWAEQIWRPSKYGFCRHGSQNARPSEPSDPFFYGPSQIQIFCHQRLFLAQSFPRKAFTRDGLNEPSSEGFWCAKPDLPLWPRAKIFPQEKWELVPLQGYVEQRLLENSYMSPKRPNLAFKTGVG